MVDFFGALVVIAVMVLDINAFTSSAQMSRTSRLVLTAGVGLWIGLAVAVAATGAFAQPRPLIGVFVGLPLVLAAIAVGRYPSARAALLSVPLPLLVGLNVPRVLGALFVWLAAVDRLSGPFPYSAGWGDVATGVIAVPAIWLAIRASVVGDRMLALWNAFGALDLVVAVALGMTSVNGSPLQLIDAGVGAGAMLVLPWSLVPTVLVPFYLIVHGIIALQLRERAGNTAKLLPAGA